MSQTDPREAMANGLSAKDEGLSELLKSPETLLNPLHTPFFKSWKIFQAENLEDHKPILLYLALGPDGTTLELTGQPDRFAEMVRQEKVSLDSPVEVEAYLELHFEICRDHGRLVYRVETAEDVKIRPNLTGEEEQLRVAFMNGLGNSIAPMEVTQQPDGYRVDYFVIEEQALFKVKASISSSGTVHQEKKKIVGDLPTVFGL